MEAINRPVASGHLELLENLGRNVTIARNAVGWTQAELAKKVPVGRSTVGKIESFNTTDVSLSTVAALAEAFEVPPYFLLLSRDDWGKLATVSSSHGMVVEAQRSRKVGLTADVERLAQQSMSGSESDKKAAAREIESISSQVLGQAPGLQKKAKESVTASTALGVSMLPDLPVLNGIIATILSFKKHL